MAQTAAVLDILVRANSRQAVAGLRSTNDSLRKVEKQTKGTEKGVRTVGRTGNRAFSLLATGAKAGALAVGVGAAAAGKKMVGLASDTEETASKFKIVFGREAAAARAELDRFSKATGTSRYALRAQAADFQALLKPMGNTTKNAAGMSKSMTKLATDLASFNNTSVDEAITALKSGLVGESEPLRRYGVQLSATRVEAHAYASGIAKTGKELTSAQKSQAAYALIMKDTKLAQGDATRTAGSFANQLKRLQANITDNATEHGVKLLPAATAVVSAMTRFITQFKEGTGVGGQFRSALEGVRSTIGSVASTVGPLVLALGRLVLGFAGSKAGIIAMHAAVGGLIGRLVGLGVAWAVGKIVAFQGAMLAAGGAVRALTVAIAANPIGFFATVIGTVVGTLIGFSNTTNVAKVSQQQFRDAILGVRDALDRYKDAGTAVKDAQLQQRGASLALKNAEANLLTLRKSGRATPLQLKQAEHDVAVARGEVERSTRAATRAERDEGPTRRKAIGDAREQINVLRGRTRTIENSLPIHKAFTVAQIAAGRGGDKLKGAMLRLKEEQLRLARATGASKEKVNQLRTEIGMLKSKKAKVTVDVGVNWPKVLKGAFPAFSGGSGDGWPISQTPDAIAAVVKKMGQRKADKLNLEDVLGGVPGSLAGPLGQGTGSLGKFRAISARMGLSAGRGPGQGYRPEDDGYHGVNRAFDSSGPAPKMMAFARFMAKQFGGSLLELIYTPLGFSIKNGRRVPPYAQADHYDHVHLAAQRGSMVPGRGSGDKVNALLEPGEGIINKKAVKAMGGRSAIDALNAAVPRFARGGVAGVVDAARSAGFKGNLLRTMSAIAMGESGGNPRARGDGGASHGLWQIYTRVWGHLARKYNLFNPRQNAKAAREVYNAQGLTAWTIYKNGAWRRHLGAVDAVLRGDARRGGKGKGKGKGGGKSSGPSAKATPPEKATRGRSSLSYADQVELAEQAIQRAEGTTKATSGIPIEDFAAGRIVDPGRDFLQKHGRMDDLKAIATKQALLAGRTKKVRARLRKINKALKGKLRKSTRTRLLAERSSLIQEMGTLATERTTLQTNRAGLYTAPETSDSGGAAAPDTSEADFRKELIAAVLALKGEMAKSNAFAENVNTITGREGLRAFSDVISRQLGGTSAQRAQTAGDGVTRARY